MTRGLITILFSLILLSTLPLTRAQNAIPGAHRMDQYLHLIQNKKTGLVVNHTSVVNESHLVDTLLSLNINIVSIFAPEHGFRGNADAGEQVSNGRDKKTGLPIISLYGKNKKPSSEQLKNIEVLIFDIQDVGVRFYTYISTMHYIMEAGAANNIPVIILDRPNPNGYYIAGPVLDPDYQSFVGMHPIPIVHGLTVGELANMINGEKWLTNNSQCNLHVIPCLHYDHNDKYSLAIKPSPNLPSDLSIALYPSLCLFEPTVVSVGRGTLFPFQQIGFTDQLPSFNKIDSTLFRRTLFTPKSIKGMSKYPKHENITCKAIRFKRAFNFDLRFFYYAFHAHKLKSPFISNVDFFNKLVGTDEFHKKLMSNISLQDIEKSWESALNDYKKMRKNYLLYADFEE